MTVSHASNGSPAICAEALRFQYADGTGALHGIDLAISRGQRVAIVGPNGAGKSTLLRHTNGLLMPTGGRLRVGDLEVTRANLSAVRRQVGFVFQDPNDQLFCPTVLEDVGFGPLHLGLPADDVVGRVQRALDAVGLSGFERRVPRNLSEGEKRLVALATVLSYDAEILVLDEPSAGLDPRNRRRLLELLRGLPKTLVVATHDLDFAWELCERTVLLVAGQIAAEGETHSLLADEPRLKSAGLELPLRLQR